MKLKEDLYNSRYAIIIIIIYGIIMQTVFNNLCIYRAITGLKCPACGLTHASLELLKGNITEAINYNPTVFLWWLVIILFFINRYIRRIKFFNFFAILCCIVTIIVFIMRLNY